MIINILTLFPEMYKGFLQESIIKRAIENKLITVNLINFRDYTTNKHKKVDDYPYGGGAGMLLSVEPIYNALQTLSSNKIILMTPQGITFNQEISEKLAKEKEITMICGHYEGFDERIRDYVDMEISIGDFILTGGELSSMVILDSVTRLLNGVIKEDSHSNDSYSCGLLEHPHYTRPNIFNNKKVPDVLLSGNHKKIEEFRMYESLKRTYLRRKDLLDKTDLNKEQLKMLDQIREETKYDKI